MLTFLKKWDQKLFYFIFQQNIFIIYPILINFMLLLGHKRPSEKIKMCLEDVTVLFDWDRPTLQSPGKMVSNFTFCNNF